MQAKSFLGIRNTKEWNSDKDFFFLPQEFFSRIFFVTARKEL